MHDYVKKLARIFQFKYADEIPQTLRSPEFSGINQKSPAIPVEQAIQSDPIPVSQEYSIPGDRFGEIDEFEPEPTTEFRDESKLSRSQQLLVYVLDKMNLNNLITPLYAKHTYHRIAKADLADLEQIKQEFISTLTGLEEEQRFFAVTISDIKRFLLDL